MTVFICLDDHGGLMFNQRRQSRDSIVIADVVNSKEGHLYINQYSSKLFENAGEDCMISDDIFADIGSTDSCFVEGVALLAHVKRISKLVIYRWNRVYPGDVHFDIDLANSTFKLMASVEFAGSSHETITKEIWNNEI